MFNFSKINLERLKYTQLEHFFASSLIFSNTFFLTCYRFLDNTRPQQMSSNDNNFLSISSGIFPCPWGRSCCSISVNSSLMSWMSCYILLKYGICDGISMAFRVSSDLSPPHLFCCHFESFSVFRP